MENENTPPRKLNPSDPRLRFRRKTQRSENPPLIEPGKAFPASLKYIKRGVEKASPHHKTVAAFGSSLRLISHSQLLTQFGPLGFNRFTLLHFLQALRIPSIHIGRERFVDAYTFYLIMHIILRPGKPDFLTPNCLAKKTLLNKRNGAGRPYRRTQRASVPLTEIERELPEAARDLIYCRNLLEPKLTTASITTLASEAAERLRTFTSHLPIAQIITRFREGADAYWLKRLNAPDPDPIDTPATLPPCPSTEPLTSSPSKESEQPAPTPPSTKKNSSRRSSGTPGTPIPTSPSEEPPSSGK